MVLVRGAWRRRYRLVAGLLVALAAFVALGGLRPASRGAVAWTSVALDTPKSQLITVAPAGATTLAWRASLLANLLTTDTVTAQLAERLDVPAHDIAVSDAGLTTALVQTDDVQAVATVSTVAAPLVLTVSDPNPAVPLIVLEAAAPSRTGAQQLAAAAVAVLRHEASPSGSFHSPVKTDGGILRRQPFVVDQVAPISEKATSARSLPRKALAASLFAFLAIVGLGGVAGRLLPARPSLRRRFAAGT